MGGGEFVCLSCIVISLTTVLSTYFGKIFSFLYFFLFGGSF